jgi:hypothetical protein
MIISPPKVMQSCFGSIMESSYVLSCPSEDDVSPQDLPFKDVENRSRAPNVIYKSRLEGQAEIYEPPNEIL